jgi:hypothetical protein
MGKTATRRPRLEAGTTWEPAAKPEAWLSGMPMVTFSVPTSVDAAIV